MYIYRPILTKNSNAIKEDKNRKKPSLKIIRPSIPPPSKPTSPPSLKLKYNNQQQNNNLKESTNYKKEIDNTKELKDKNILNDNTKDSKLNSIQNSLESKIKDNAQQDKSPYSSLHSDDLISEFTLEEVNEILNCKLSDDEENELLNDTNYTRKLLQQQFSHAKSLQHLSELEKEEQVKTIENGLNGLKLKAIEFKEQQQQQINKDQIELDEKLILTKNDLIKNLNKKFSTGAKIIDEDKSCNLNRFESRFNHKFINIDSKLDDECLNENVIFNLRKTGNHHLKVFSKLGNNVINSPINCSKDYLNDDYEKPICRAGNEMKSKIVNDLKENENSYLATTTSTEAISPPPEFDDKQDKQNKLNNLNKHLDKQLDTRWSSIDLVKQFDTNRLNSHHLITPPVSFSSLTSTNKLTTSMIALPSNKPKLPIKNKIDFLNANSSRLLPTKLKSLPEIFTSKINNHQKLLYSLANEKNLFKSTSLVNQIKCQKQHQQHINSYQQVNQQLANQQQQLGSITNRPLPPLPLISFSWFHDLERETASNLLMNNKFAKEGSYLVRTSKRAGSNSPYSLSVYHDGKVFNLNIRKREDGLFALGKEKDKEKVFIEFK